MKKALLVLAAWTSVACSSESRPSAAVADGGAPGAQARGDGGVIDPNGAPPTSDAGCLGGQPPNKAADITIDPAYAAHYTAFDLGQVPGLPQGKYGGMVLLAGDENTLLIGGSANFSNGAIFAVPLLRSACKHIVGFGGPATKVADAPYIDGGLVYGAGGTLMFAAWPMDEMVRQTTSGMIGIIPPGAGAPTKIIHGSTFFMPEALSALAFVPPGFPGAGRLKLVTWEGGSFYDATLALDSNGRPSDITAAKFTLTVPGGPEGFAYVPQGSPQFAAPSMVMAEWSKNSVATYVVDASGDPSLATRKSFLTGLSGAEGAFFDPATGDFVFSTWNLTLPERVVVVLGFVPFAAPK